MTAEEQDAERTSAMVRCLLDQYQRLPPHGKAATRSNGKREWTVLAGIVMAHDPDVQPPSRRRSRDDTCASVVHKEKGTESKESGPEVVKAVRGKACYRVAALATGNKSLRADRVAESRGRWVHDCHAEILVVRAFNRFLLGLLEEETPMTVRDTFLQESACTRHREDDNACGTRVRYTWRKEWTLHLVISEVPCGEASMTLTMAQQIDPSPWTQTSGHDTSVSQRKENPHLCHNDDEQIDQICPGHHLAASSDSEGRPIRGRAYFDQVGRLRTKPGRADALTSPWKSCSDKLAVLFATSLLKTLCHCLIDSDHLFLASMVLPQNAAAAMQASSADGIRRCEAAFTGRINGARSISIHWSKELDTFVDRRSPERVSAHQSLVHIPALALTEVLSEGRRMGAPKHADRSQSMLSKQSLGALVLRHLNDQLPLRTLTYNKLKITLCPEEMTKRKTARLQLGHWTDGVDNDFVLWHDEKEKLPSKKEKRKRRATVIDKAGKKDEELGKKRQKQEARLSSPLDHT